MTARSGKASAMDAEIGKNSARAQVPRTPATTDLRRHRTAPVLPKLNLSNIGKQDSSRSQESIDFSPTNTNYHHQHTRFPTLPKIHKRPSSRSRYSHL